jgi:hypothetical protein
MVVTGVFDFDCDHLMAVGEQQVMSRKEERSATSGCRGPSMGRQSRMMFFSSLLTHPAGHRLPYVCVREGIAFSGSGSERLCF